ncbi:riboflavin kinase [Paragonimus westermani]|uniref:riboflavin kinase n=1 Tax=Paragonimus westermani TaxID=34504 RepID=A0A5J4N7X1_9TREM|nr:riboflavin kinase [Paragonimus westermani]
MRLEFPPGIIFYAAGKVVHGFGRGSKQLGVPTGKCDLTDFIRFVRVANLEESVVSRLPASLQNGIYFGWAKVDQHPVTKTVVSVGWNPFFKNSKRSVEAHLIGKIDGDFYGSVIQLLILKYHRPEKDFVNLSEFSRHYLFSSQ